MLLGFSSPVVMIPSRSCSRLLLTHVAMSLSFRCSESTLEGPQQSSKSLRIVIGLGSCGRGRRVVTTMGLVQRSARLLDIQQHPRALLQYLWPLTDKKLSNLYDLGRCMLASPSEQYSCWKLALTHSKYSAPRARSFFTQLLRHTPCGSSRLHLSIMASHADQSAST